MLGGLSKRLVLAAILAGAALSAPTAAFGGGCSGGPSAVNVYKECVPTGGGAKPTGTAQKSSGATKPSRPVSPRTARVLSHVGKKDRALLLNMARNGPRRLQSASSSSATEPSAIGSAFDLGSGPTALLAVLAATALALLGASGLRGWRRWRTRA